MDVQTGTTENTSQFYSNRWNRMESFISLQYKLQETAEIMQRFKNNCIYTPLSKKPPFLFSLKEKRSSPTEQDGNQGENIPKEVWVGTQLQDWFFYRSVKIIKLFSLRILKIDMYMYVYIYTLIYRSQKPSKKGLMKVLLLLYIISELILGAQQKNRIQTPLPIYTQSNVNKKQKYATKCTLQTSEYHQIIKCVSFLILPYRKLTPVPVDLRILHKSG